MTTDLTWKEIIKIINGNNLIDIIPYFNDVIEIGNTDLRITREELVETLQDWVAMGNTNFPEHTVSVINNDLLKIKLISVPDDFFLPISSDTFYVKFSNNVIVSFSETEN